MVYIIFTLVILFLIAISGFISGAETAITGASKAHLYHLAKKGDERAKKVISLREKMTTSIGTILVINQIFLYFIPMISVLFSVKYLSPAETAVVQALIGAATITYAEIFPKMVAIQFTSKYALFVAPFVKSIVTLLKPLVSVLEFCARFSLRLMRVNMEDRLPDKSDDELRGAIEMHESGGDEDEAQKKIMLKSILDLEEITVSHIMVHRKNLKTIDVSLPLEKIAAELTSCPFSRIPVWKDNPENIIGVLKTKTFFRAVQLGNGDMANMKINSLISPPWFIPETTHLLDQLQNFRKKREHFALVVDEYGDLMGCITLEDILEEIVGEITDEYDDATASGVRLHSDGCVIADGTTPVRDLNRQFNWNIPEEEAATIAGYIMHELRKIPDVGQIYVLSNYKIEILRRQRNQIGLVKIIPVTSSVSE
ncbi:MAG: CNNM domain-containing protein [Holosporaceae bacterium]|jgi:Mg2+/Co2+ transporter CorB|nr:CNNM domain-containing protein [Holosporaceae bacterium]